ncbi:Panacea domain-containing protein [Arthrobacter sp. H-02-3]|uniref:Panacea domain-containing protein n=1 Tax=Arthrobacter sp. H-02-3 TaxID=2703675 RepID=UPI000DD193D9|nr:type II toxin-antitoxin system antitoxin SocA domain-containing protein [Arthrobacter sp. H-02-3]PVZ53036.1 hypothetical protein C9424_18820 [Arthrobacter sp. H-02-3]
MTNDYDNVDVLFSHHLSVEAVTNFFLDMDASRQEPDVTPLKLQKLLYFAQANYLASTDQRLFDENLEAFRHGPVVYKTYQRYMNINQILVAREVSPAVETARVPEDVEHFLAAIWDKYKDFSAGQLRNLTHLQDPWLHNYEEGSYRTVIPDDELRGYFRHKVPASERVFHEAVALVPAGFIESLDEDAIAAQMRDFWA